MMKEYFWKIWAVLLVLSIFWLSWAMRTSAPMKAQNRVSDKIRAKKFVLVDKMGNPRAQLCTDPDGDPGLYLDDHSGIGRAGLFLREDGWPALQMWDKRAVTRLWIGFQVEGPPGIIIFDAKGGALFSAP